MAFSPSKGNVPQTRTSPKREEAPLVSSAGPMEFIPKAGARKDKVVNNSTMGNGSDIKAMDPGLQTQERHEYDSMAASIRASLHGDISHIPQAIRDGKGTEFVPANYCKHFPHDLAKEEDLGVVPPKWKTTQQLSDPRPPKELRVKSGYTGHVPHVRKCSRGSPQPCYPSACLPPGHMGSQLGHECSLTQDRITTRAQRTAHTLPTQRGAARPSWRPYCPHTPRSHRQRHAPTILAPSFRLQDGRPCPCPTAA